MARSDLPEPSAAWSLADTRPIQVWGLSQGHFRARGDRSVPSNVAASTVRFDADQCNQPIYARLRAHSPSCPDPDEEPAGRKIA